MSFFSDDEMEMDLAEFDAMVETATNRATTTTTTTTTARGGERGENDGFFFAAAGEGGTTNAVSAARGERVKDFRPRDLENEDEFENAGNKKKVHTLLASPLPPRKMQAFRRRRRR